MDLQGQKNLYLLILALSVFAIVYVQAAPDKQTTKITGNIAAKSEREIEKELTDLMDCIGNTKIIGGFINQMINVLRIFFPELVIELYNFMHYMIKYIINGVQQFMNFSDNAMNMIDIRPLTLKLLENVFKR